MAYDTAYVDALVEELAPLGEVTARAMFGGAGIFESGTMFALVTSDNRLHFRVDETNQPAYVAAGSAKYGKMPYWSVPEEVESVTSLLQEWAGVAISVAHANKKK